MNIRKGTIQDLDEISVLYDTLNDYLDCHINYPGWRKGIYPIREDAEAGISENSLFVAEMDGRIAGTFILRHTPEEAYSLADWHTSLDYDSIFVLYTFAVHPHFLHQGVGHNCMQFILDYSVQQGMKAIRLDVYEKNIPAIRLYEKMGFTYIDSVDLGYGSYDLNQFRLYQRILSE